jgi:hypothetical protein
MYDRTAAESPVTAAKCSMREIAKILSKLRAEDAFENSLIIVVADHGGMRPVQYAKDIDRGLASLMAAANPALIVHFPGAHGLLQENKAPVSIADIAATVCEATASCAARGGKPLQHANLSSSDARRRIFNHYSWRNEYWRLSKVPNVRTFEITGDVRNPASWSLIGRARLTTDSVIDFRGNRPNQYLGFGWSDSEPWGRWTEGAMASLRLSMDTQPGSKLTLNLRAQAFLGSKNRQNVIVNVNKLHVGEWVFDQPGIFERSFRIPPSALRRDQNLDIELKIGSPQRPIDIGLNDDPRALGIGLYEARITAD